MKLSTIASIFFVVCTIMTLCTACHLGTNQAEKPNIILIYADDLGIGLLGVEGQKIINSKLSPVAEDEVFLGTVAKEAGYITAQFGKLEWGFATTHKQMIRHGWDHYLGYFDHVRAHGFYPPFLFGNGGLTEIKGNTLINCGKSLEPETDEAFDERWNMAGKSVYSQTL